MQVRCDKPFARLTLQDIQPCCSAAVPSSSVRRKTTTPRYGFITNKSSQQHHHHHNEVPSPNLQYQRPHLKSPNSSNSASEKLALPPVHPSHEQSHTVFATRSEKKKQQRNEPTSPGRRGWVMGVRCNRQESDSSHLPCFALRGKERASTDNTVMIDRYTGQNARHMGNR